MLTPLNPPFTCLTCYFYDSIVCESSLPSDVNSFNQHGVDTSIDFPDPAGPVAPHFLSFSEHPALLGNDGLEVLSPLSICILIEDAAALAENILGVNLQPPSEENVGTNSLLTPQAPTGSGPVLGMPPHWGVPTPTGSPVGSTGLMVLLLSLQF
ncbi:hypothetical protein PAXRUDRAFT_22872 [Paxillus rubicundulus Ve08.2h10]|uniref:Unplaced genomic scaffold scaffold_6879, whole genome shotgun sequence n=1 Tax=Paxillus rubicundulus Ve08.2h10 TaxID=930991 RepID=A0A0D0C7X0_9AGAM|nr:hypothetical protein PAXRUDRAFT_22872 [Paxillus rubicundulus Ve08.2h10]